MTEQEQEVANQNQKAAPSTWDEKDWAEICIGRALSTISNKLSPKDYCGFASNLYVFLTGGEVPQNPATAIKSEYLEASDA